MNVEQLFDSVLVATQAQDAFGSNWDTVQRRRQQWLQQFVQAWDTDENDEADLFDGTIPQALMMMNKSAHYLNWQQKLAFLKVILNS